jgi:hypothetical protein
MIKDASHEEQFPWSCLFLLLLRSLLKAPFFPLVWRIPVWFISSSQKCYDLKVWCMTIWTMVVLWKRGGSLLCFRGMYWEMWYRIHSPVWGRDFERQVYHVTFCKLELVFFIVYYKNLPLFSSRLFSIKIRHCVCCVCKCWEWVDDDVRMELMTISWYLYHLYVSCSSSNHCMTIRVTVSI